LTLPRNRSVLPFAIGLAAMVVILFWRVRENQFLNFDDDIYVYLNNHVKAGLTFDGIRWAFTDTSNGNWHPLTWISHMLDVDWFGLNPADHHFVNVLWHAANSALLMAALWYMTGCLWRSAFVAALFALHPLRVESVAWISERKDVLSSFFYLSTIWAYAWYTRRPAWQRYLAVVALLSLGLMSKASVVTAPALLLLLDYWPLRRKEPLRALLREKIPLFVLSIGVSLATYLGQKQAGAMNSIANLALTDRLSNALVSYVRYLGKIFWPNPLAAIYPYQRDLPALSVIASALLLAAITALVMFRARQSRYLLVGWFWFLGAMVPMIGLVQVGCQPYADRYTYISSIGIFIALVWLIADAFDNRKWKREVVIAAGCMIMPALAFQTWTQLPYWHDDLTLFLHAIETTPPNPVAQYHVGNDLVELGRNTEAIPHLEETIRLRTSFYPAYYTLGKAQAGVGNTSSALRNFSEAIRLNPGYADAHYARALSLMKAGDNQSAELDLHAALTSGLRADYSADAHNALGVILAQRGDFAHAADEFEQAVRIQPSSIPAQRNLAFALLSQGRTADAIARLRQAIGATHDASLTKMLEDIQGSR
jgi:tetratricopeptide (TPR) repeat protein